MLERIGPDGMSTDGTDVKNCLPQYQVFIKPWRSAEVTAWLRTFDAIRRYTKAGPVRQNAKGNAGRIRFVSTAMSGSSKVVRHLPKNAYNPEWLRTIAEFDRGILDVQQEEFPFAHTHAMQT